jgi:nitroimidazol reductase NimA-like FMN-containing flavoprotein (pyridoxamine 5'-phosphate oxidase superfamily)
MAEIIGPTYPWSEIVKFIYYRKLAALATSAPSGEPRVDPTIYASDDKYIYICIIPETRKLQNLQENNKVAIAIVDAYNEDWSRFGSLIIRGEVEFIDPLSEEYEKVVSLFKGKYVQVTRRGVAILMDQKAAPIIKIDLEKAKISTGVLYSKTDEEMLAMMEKFRKEG